MNKNTLSQLFFLLIFPGLFFYSSAVAAGMPAYIGGGFGVLASLALALLFPAVLMSLPRLRGTPLIVTLLFLSLMAYACAWLAVHYLFGGGLYRQADVVDQWVILIASWAALFAIGYFWREPPVRLLAVALIAMAGLVATNLNTDHLIYQAGLSDAPGTLSYQGLARSVAIPGLVLVAVIRSQYKMWIAVALLLVTVFLTGARSELVGVMMTLPVIVYYHFARRPVRTMAVMLLAVSAATVFVISNYETLMLSRQAQLLNIDESNSITTRMQLQIQALAAIAQSPILGDFAGQAREEIGLYAHSIISSWRQLGIVGFILYSMLLVLPVAVIAYRILKRTALLEINAIRIAGVFSVYTMVLSLGAKSIFWPFAALNWGLFVAALTHPALLCNRPSGWWIKRSYSHQELQAAP